MNDMGAAVFRVLEHDTQMSVILSSMKMRTVRPDDCLVVSFAYVPDATTKLGSTKLQILASFLSGMDCTLMKFAR